jgi:hypothetical protein
MCQVFDPALPTVVDKSDLYPLSYQPEDTSSLVRFPTIPMSCFLTIESK